MIAREDRLLGQLVIDEHDEAPLLDEQLRPATD
jgi:hypothetical protein